MGFFCDFTLDKRKMHSVSWDVVTFPKDNGILDIWTLKELNEVFIMKIV